MDMDLHIGMRCTILIHGYILVRMYSVLTCLSVCYLPSGLPPPPDLGRIALSLEVPLGLVAR